MAAVTMRRILPRRLRGVVRMQPSKSAAHRALCCAALAPGVSTLRGLSGDRSEDIAATLAALRAMGLCRVIEDGSVLRLEGGLEGRSGFVADCAESGSTLRFLVPIAWALGLEGRFLGRGRLLERPMQPYADIARAQGLRFETQGDALCVAGRLRAENFRVPGDISSQFITGLLLALPRLQGGGTGARIEIIGELESKGYIDMTLGALEGFGVRADWDTRRADTSALATSGAYRAAEYSVEGDWSHAAFWLTAGVDVCGLDPHSRQGDRAIVALLSEMGAEAGYTEAGAFARGAAQRGAVIDARDIPDLVPALCVAACAARGETRIAHAARLRMKESDRLRAMATELARLGARIAETEDGLCIEGTGRLQGGACDAHGDHRIAMALAIASTLCTEAIHLTGADSVRKSAPAFWYEFASVGGIAEEMV